MKIIINAENLVLGRLATFVAKKAMQGDEVDIINADKAVITGKKDLILKKYLHRRERGDPHHGPYFPREPELIVRRTIRGMIPYKQTKGMTAYRNVKCYNGIPSGFKDKEFFVLENAKLKGNIMQYMEVGRLAKLMGSSHGK